MKKLACVVGLLLMLGACSGAQGPGYATESECYAAPPKSIGETGVCAFYPGFGWGHVPVYHPITQG